MGLNHTVTQQILESVQVNYSLLFFSQYFYTHTCISVKKCNCLHFVGTKTRQEMILCIGAWITHL